MKDSIVLMENEEIRFTLHALQEIARRKLDVRLVERTINTPDYISLVEMGRWAYVSQYNDVGSGKAFVIRVIIERTASGVSVVTVYRSSRVRRYLKDQEL